MRRITKDLLLRIPERTHHSHLSRMSCTLSHLRETHRTISLMETLVNKRRVLAYAVWRGNYQNDSVHSVLRNNNIKHLIQNVIYTEEYIYIYLFISTNINDYVLY